MGSSWGKSLKISIFGESHGPAIGVVIDGFPAGIKIDEEYIAGQMARRAPGNTPWSTKRKEDDIPNVLSGVKQGISTGSPICAMIKNTDAKSDDYTGITTLARPGHADHTAYVRYKGNADMRGSGHFSGRLTAPLVFAGALCRIALLERDIKVAGRIFSIAHITDNSSTTEEQRYLDISAQDFPVFDGDAAQKMQDAIKDALSDCDSVGGTIELRAFGVPAGWGSPMFDGLENRISSILFAVPAVKGVAFGDGFDISGLRGSQANDGYIMQDNKVTLTSNHNGGIIGGISNGAPLIAWVAVKPTPSISQEQSTINLLSGDAASITVKGRHDPCIVPRALPVLEAALAVALMDIAIEMEGCQ